MTQPKEIITKYIAPTWIECAYCSVRFDPGDPSQNDHWRTCQKHPARAELARLAEEVARLQVENETMAYNEAEGDKMRLVVAEQVKELQVENEALQADNEVLRQAIKALEKTQEKLAGRLADAEAY